MTATMVDPAHAVVQSWRNVDHEAGHEGEYLWTEDCEYRTPGIVIKGRDAMRKALAARTANGPRTTRHLVTNTFVRYEAPGRATVGYYLTLFGADGEPILPIDDVPIAVGDMVDELVRDGEDSAWLIARRAWTPIFVADWARSPFLTGDGLPAESRQAT